MKFLVALSILLSLALFGCREIRTYNDYNGRTTAEIRATWGEPSSIERSTTDDFKYGADEMWKYPSKKGGLTSYLFFKDGIVVNYEVRWDVTL